MIYLNFPWLFSEMPKTKLGGYLKLMKRPDVIAYLHLLLDVLSPLRLLSLTLQSNQTTLADVGEKIDVARDVISAFKERYERLTFLRLLVLIA